MKDVIDMEYETIMANYVDYGRNKFLEVSRKRVKPEMNEFLNISKGYYTPDGERRYQGGIGFPDDEQIVKELIGKFEALISAESSKVKD